MRTYQTTVREGEYLGPVDWTYDFEQHSWSSGKGGVNPQHVRERIEMLRQLTDGGDWEGTTDGGWHACWMGQGIASWNV